MKLMILSLLFAVVAGCEQHITTTATGGGSDQTQETEKPVTEVE